MHLHLMSCHYTYVMFFFSILNVHGKVIFLMLGSMYVDNTDSIWLCVLLESKNDER